MNGGYQTLDLRNATEGDPVTIKGAFETVKGSNGKTILVEDKDGQEVFAQSKEVNGDYVITYISAEGKTVKVTITDEDAVTTVISDDGASITALTQAVAEINNRVSANTFDYPIVIDQSQYSDEDHLYLINNDGYLRIQPPANGSLTVFVIADGVKTPFAQVSNGIMTTIYVKKDTGVCFSESGGTGEVKAFTFE